MASINTLIVTFNCGREPIKPDIFAQHLAQSLSNQNPEMIVFSFQEVAPIPYAFLGGSFLSFYYQKVHTTLDILRRWGSASYLSILEQNKGMTAIFLFIREDIADRVDSVEMASVGVGWLELGNKGAVAARLGCVVENKVRSLTFVSAHLAPMENNRDRRNQDWMNITKRLVFEPVQKRMSRRLSRDSRVSRESEASETLLQHDMAGIYCPSCLVFIAGDLNYRTSDKNPASEDFTHYPNPGENELDLFKRDQLTAEMKAGRTMHGFLEAPITFPPTYKYSNERRSRVRISEEIGSTAESTEHSLDDFGWARHRWPSWCDRVLYLDNSDENAYFEASIRPRLYTSLPLMSTSDHRAVLFGASIAFESTPRLESIATEFATNDRQYIKPPYPIDRHFLGGMPA